MPSVTILIPAYNAANFVEDAIRSALHQTYKDLEVVVVDDGSVDDTSRKVESFGGAVRLLRVKHGGLAWARNHGMRAATGRYIVFLDADDILEPHLVTRAIRFLERLPELAFVFCNVRVMFPDGRTTPRIPAHAFGEEPEIVLKNPLEQVLEAGHMISSSGLCARREALLEAGFFDESLWGAEDFEYWSRLYLRRLVGYIDDPLVRLRRHSDNMTLQAARMIPCMAASMEKVAARCLSSGRLDMVRTVRRYGARSIGRALRGLLLRGERSEARVLLRRYRRHLHVPDLVLLAAACVVPGSTLRAMARIRSRLFPART